jgi:hypothetical protein
MRGRYPDNHAQRKCRDDGKRAGRFPQLHGAPRFSEAFFAWNFLRAKTGFEPK